MIIGLQRPHGFCKPIEGIDEAPVPTAGEDGVFPEIKPLPKSVPEGDIDLRGRTITLKQRVCAMARLGCLCVACQLVAALALGSTGQLGPRRSASYFKWAEVETDIDNPYGWERDTFHASYDLWNQYVARWDDDDEFDGKEITIKACERAFHDIIYTGQDKSYETYCEKIVAATLSARVTTFLALLLMALGALGLCCCQRNSDCCGRRSSDPKASALRFERFSIFLAVGGFIGLVGAASYSSKLATAVKGLDDANDKVTNTCAAGCALSLSFSLIAMVAGPAVVFLQRKYARASETDDLATRASKPTTDKKSGGCCAGDEKVHGCCAVPKGSCKGRAAQVTSILGLISAVIFLILSLVYYTWFWAVAFIHLDLPEIGIGIYIQLVCLLLSIIAYSRGLCCATGERGWNCTAGFLRVLAVLYVVAIACIEVGNNRLDRQIDKKCHDSEKTRTGCDGSSLHSVFSITEASVFINLAFVAITAYLLKRAVPDWVDRDAVEAPSPDEPRPGVLVFKGGFMGVALVGLVCVAGQAFALGEGLRHWARFRLEGHDECTNNYWWCGAFVFNVQYDLWTFKVSSFDPHGSSAEGNWKIDEDEDKCNLAMAAVERACINKHGSCVRNSFCADFAAATQDARARVWVALIFAAIAVLGSLVELCGPGGRCYRGKTKSKVFLGLSMLLAVGGGVSLDRTSHYGYAMEELWDEVGPGKAVTCMMGCQLGLSAGVIATVFGSAAVVLQLCFYSKHSREPAEKQTVRDADDQSEEPAEPAAPLAEEEA